MSSLDEMKLIVENQLYVHFCIGIKRGQKIEIRSIQISEDVVNFFRNIAIKEIERMELKESRDWTPDDSVTNENYLTISLEDIGESPLMHRDHGESTFFSIITQEGGATCSPQSWSQIDQVTVCLYSISFKNGDSEIVFIKKSNPQRGVKGKNLFTFISGNEEIKKLTEPVLIFSDTFDFVVSEGQMHILSESEFYDLFRSSESISARIPGWISEINSHLVLSDPAKRFLEEKAIKSSRLAKKIESVVYRSDFDKLNYDFISKVMPDVSLNPSDYFNDDKEVILDDGNYRSFINFINEDMFRGIISQKIYNANSKHAAN